MDDEINIKGWLYEFSEEGGRGTPTWTIESGGSVYLLKSGDLLTIFNGASTVAWQGKVDLVPTRRRYPAPSDTQAGMPKKKWREFFSLRCPATAQLRKPEKVASFIISH